MGQEQSNNSGAPTDSAFHIWPRKGKERAKSGRLVVVNPGNRNRDQNVSTAELNRLEEIPVFYPILRSNLNMPGVTNSPDIRTKICPVPVCDVFQRLQHHLSQNAERISSEQRKLIVKVRKIDSMLNSVKTNPYERFSQFTRLNQELLRVDVLCSLIGKVDGMLQECASIVRDLNMLLPLEDRLQELRLNDHQGAVSDEQEVEVQRVIDVFPQTNREAPNRMRRNQRGFK